VSGLGSKMGMDATHKWPGETNREWGRTMQMTQEVTANELVPEAGSIVTAGLARAGARFIAHGRRIAFGLSAPGSLMYKWPRAAGLGVYAAKHKGRNCVAVVALFLMRKNDNTSLRSAGNNC
jgi:hypothetical protein